MSKIEEQRFIDECLLLIEQKIGWGSADNWHSKVFDELSDFIQKETNVLLSPTTLKRVWGKINYGSAPSISTLNTLSQFAGFLNWRDFKTKHEIYPAERVNKKRNNQTKVFVYAAVLAVFFISLFSVIGNSGKSKDGIDYSKVKFESQPVVLGLPNSVIFDLDLKGLKSDSIYIQQYWDKTKTIKLKQGQTQATGQYYFPGYFRAKLVVDGDIKKEHDLFIKSDGWLGTIDYEPIPKYFKEERVIGENLSLPNDALKEIINSEKPLMSSLHFIEEFDSISGDNFELKTSIKSLYLDKWAVCQKTYIIVVGTKSALIIPFAIPGCVSEIGVMLSDKYLNGKEYDLSAFGTDLTNFKDIMIQVKKKMVKVFVEDEVVFMGKYNSSIGDVAGIRYRFLGAGEVDYLYLNSIDTKEAILNQDF